MTEKRCFSMYQEIFGEKKGKKLPEKDRKGTEWSKSGDISFFGGKMEQKEHKMTCILQFFSVP